MVASKSPEALNFVTVASKEQRWTTAEQPWSGIERSLGVMI